MKKSRIGLFGGTFNPVHIAHLVIAERFCEELFLEKCYFVPANISPFKVNNDSANEVSPESRLEMLWLAIEGKKHFETDVFEIDNPDISYTFKTVDYFCEKYPYKDIFLLIGSDQAIFFKEWKNWEHILSKINICVALRSALTKEEREEINEILSYKGKKPYWLKSPIIEISSTEIRHRINSGKSIDYILPSKVKEFIFKNKLYSAK